nr:GlcNAc-transferase family protein [Leucobacter salsicius]
MKFRQSRRPVKCRNRLLKPRLCSRIRVLPHRPGGRCCWRPRFLERASSSCLRVLTAGILLSLQPSHPRRVDSQQSATILLKFAAYRDTELVPTLQAALSRAEFPSRLRFAIVNQVGPETAHQLDSVRGNPNFNIHEVAWSHSLGLGWARRLCDQMWSGETFSLQLDSHMRFQQGWDTTLVADWESRKDPKVVLSCYPAIYGFRDGHEFVQDVLPHRIVVDGLTEHGAPLLRTDIDGCRCGESLFVAGGFQFAAGAVSIGVPNHEYIFVGDETAHSIRLFTHGYRVEAPKSIPIYHLYNRHEWMDIDYWPENMEADERSRARYQKLLQVSQVMLKSMLSVEDGTRVGAVRSKADFAEKARSFRGAGWQGSVMQSTSD